MAANETTYEWLWRLASEPLSAQARADLEAAVLRDPTAAARLARIEAMLTCIRCHHAVDPSPAALAGAKQIAEQRRRLPAAKPSWLEVVQTAIAQVLFDSRLQPSLGLRGDEPGFQLSYEGDLGDVDLDLQPEGGGRWLLLGHINPREAILIDEIVLCPSGCEADWTPVEFSGRGAFRVALDRARYDLVIRSGERAMLIREIELT